uniref:RNA-directed RNA polymerase n=1 Tax=Raphidiopteran tombus-related virus TaxID=2822559 RepID=A0A8A6RRN8_9TOMB|nr:RNA-dependent RNA polymerase [Raphidiopteran tombus-related virus]
MRELEQGGKVTNIITPFTKIEKLSTSKYKAPRLIQARHKSFNIEYGCYIKPLEQFLGKEHHHKHHFGKGNYDEIARRINKLRKRYRYYTEADHSTFDAHVTVEMLRLTHTFYQSVYRHDRKLRRLSAQTINNNCKSRQGDHYRIRGTRMSGDVDTSLGNSLINYAIIMRILDELGIKGDAIVNGDDSIIFSDEPIPVVAVDLFRKYNMETVMNKSTDNIYEVEFCRTKLCLNGDGNFTMMIDPKRIVKIFGMTNSQIKSYQTYLIEVLVCMQSINKSSLIGVHLQKLIDDIVASPSIKQKYKIPIYNHNFKMLSADMLRVYRRQLATKTLTNDQASVDVFHSWPYLYDFRYVLSKLYYKIVKLCEMQDINTTNLWTAPVGRHIYVNHNLKTIAIDDVSR